MAARKQPLALDGTFRKADGHWQMEIPDVGCKSENTSVLVCIREVEDFFKELFDDEDLHVDLKMNDGGEFRITAVPK